MRTSNLQLWCDEAVAFIRGYVSSSGLPNAIIGLSGGIDSSLSATLAVKALGREHVYGVMLPWKNSQPASYDDALSVAQWLGIQHERIDITPMVDSYFQTYQPEADNLRKGNWMARIRMCVLYDLSAQYRALVVGTSNRTELLVGYFTHYGDGACGFEPIGHLYKTEVWAMGRLLGIPENIVNKTPTADLWAQQTDEGELGILYPRLDEILYRLTELRQSSGQLPKDGFTESEITRVTGLMQRSTFKRQLPPLITDWHAGK